MGPGQGDPGLGGGLDPSLMQPLGGGDPGGMGILGGSMGMGGAPGMGGGGLNLGGGGTVFGQSLPGLLDGASLSPPAAIGAATDTAPVLGALASDQSATAVRPGQPAGHVPILISSSIHADPAAMRIQTDPTETGADVTLAIPLTGEVSLSAEGRGGRKTDLSVAGVATARLRLAKLGTNQWQPTGIGVMVSVSDEEPPFHISSLTIAPAGGRSWTITDATAIAPFDELPNIPAGTKVTVTAAVTGDTSQALPFLVANGRLMHLTAVEGGTAAAGDEEAPKTFSRTFTLAPMTLTKDRITQRKDAGMIGVKVLNLKSLSADPRARSQVESTGWAVCFPSQDSGKATGFAELQNAGRLNRHIQAILQIINANEHGGKVLIADHPLRQTDQPVRQQVTVD
jgi:hypothetical protein